MSTTFIVSVDERLLFVFIVFIWKILQSLTACLAACLMAYDMSTLVCFCKALCAFNANVAAAAALAAVLQQFIQIIDVFLCLKVCFFRCYCHSCHCSSCYVSLSFLGGNKMATITITSSMTSGSATMDFTHY